MKLTFLLGSGISRPAGLPAVQEITEAVLSDGEIAKKKDRANPERA